MYDGCHDEVGAAALLTAITGEQDLLGEPAGVAARGHRAAGAARAAVREARVLRGEQSNTSVILDTEPGPAVILKVFRVLHPGRNPDVEVQQALAAAGSTRVPRPVGDLLGRWPAVAVAGAPEGDGEDRGSPEGHPVEGRPAEGRLAEGHLAEGTSPSPRSSCPASPTPGGWR